MSLEKMRRKCQQLTDEERMAILQKATAGTLALLGDNDYPYAVPISYAYREVTMPHRCYSTVTTSSKCSFPQSMRAVRTGIKEHPVSVSEYSTRGGTSGKTCRCTR